jgi:hypothetical protein
MHKKSTWSKWNYGWLKNVHFNFNFFLYSFLVVFVYFLYLHSKVTLDLNSYISLPQSYSTFYIHFLISLFPILNLIYSINSFFRDTFSKSKRDKITIFNKKEQNHAFILIQVFYIQSRTKLEIKAITFFYSHFSCTTNPISYCIISFSI